MELDLNGMEVLSDQECMRLLGRNGIGRVGLTIGALPVILPVNYAVDGGSVYFMTAVGSKLSAATDGAVIAFEVDRSDVMSHTGWSVLAVGQAVPVADSEEAALRKRLPLSRWITGGGPDHLVRITPKILSGRRISQVVAVA